MSTKPFLKWPGGKAWASQEIVDVITSRNISGKYIEPFLGSGAVFFKLAPKKSLLSDINGELINTYQQVREKHSTLISRLKDIPVTKNKYYEIRSKYKAGVINNSVRFLYLNRTSFSGMYRLNQKGEFNVPYGGGDRTPSPLWENNLLKSASKLLSYANIQNQDFEKIINKAKKGDCVYCDPTYTVAHAYNNGFIRYNENNFSWDDQIRLRDAAFRAVNRGVFVIVSNAHHKEIRRLYSPVRPKILRRISCISPKLEARREVKEYLYILDPE